MQKLNEISAARRAKGETPLPKINRHAIYDLYLGAGEVPPLRTLEAIADVLDVRAVWLAFGVGPMERSVMADSLRELYLVDGAIAEDHRPPVGPDERKRARRAFQRVFNRRPGNRGEERLRAFTDTVHELFANYLARFLQRRRDRGEGRPDDPAWRGQQAAEQLSSAIERARKHGLQRHYGSPQSTAAMVRALADMMIAQNPGPKGG